MANPQKEKGFVGIANELFEQFYIRKFKLFQIKILLFVLRYSYGCNKKEAIITPQNNFCLLHLHECDIKRELKSLESANVLYCDYKKGIFSINKNFAEWQIPISDLFDNEKNTKLLHLNLCKSQSKTFVNHKENFVNNKDEKLCEEQRTLQITKKNLCKSQSKTFVNHKDLQSDNTNSESVSGVSKDILNTDKDNNNTYIYDYIEEQKTEKIKKDDPFYGHIQKVFCEEYKKVFKRNCFLNYAQKMALVEIDYENPDFEENLPILIEKFSKIKFVFAGKVQKVGLRWLLEQGNWSGVLSGDFDDNIATDEVIEEKTYSREDGWDL